MTAADHGDAEHGARLAELLQRFAVTFRLTAPPGSAAHQVLDLTGPPPC